MPRKPQGMSMGHPIIVTFLILAIIAFMYFAAEFLKPLVLAILLAFALAPIAGFLERRGLPRALAVVLSVVVVLGTLGGVGVVVWNQLNALTENIDAYRENIKSHLTQVFTSDDETTLEKLNELGMEVTKGLGEDASEAEAAELGTTERPQKVEVVERPTFRERLEQAVGPFLEIAAVGSIVVILVMFILIHRDNLSDRIIRLFGARQITLTTRTMDEVGQRISRYLGMFATVIDEIVEALKLNGVV